MVNWEWSNGFLPITREDMKNRGWDELDFLYISGDAYVDHILKLSRLL